MTVIQLRVMYFSLSNQLMILYAIPPVPRMFRPIYQIAENYSVYNSPVISGVAKQR